ncbi:reverse transcriptase domain-containing protein [Tanacetum coccineum]|uniref:Reverse transcriptase domain-containing protein n=1 Tax=Tanacetum coccineum TaxID=301880 RepID=A0ABQ5FY25_9ASTR
MEERYSGAPESVSKTDERIDKLADQISTLVEIVSKKVVTPAPVKAVEEICVTCSGPHAWYNCLNTDSNQSSVCAVTGPYNQVNTPNRASNYMAPPGFAPVQNNGQNRLWTRNEKMDKDKEQSNFQGSTAHIPPPVNPIPIPEPDVPKTLPKLNIPYPSRRNDQKSRDKASNQIEKIFQIFQDLRFDTSFADALLLMPRFAPTIRNLPHDKEKLREFAKIKSIEICRRCSSKSFPKSWRSGKFLFHVISENDVCSRLGRSRASINLCPFSIVGKKMFLSKVGSFSLSYDFVVVDFEADPRVPLILGRSFLRTGRALINVFEGELILRDGNEQIIFHDDGISKHPQKHVNESIKIVNVTCEDSFEETNNLSSGSTTPLSDFHPSLESFETSKSLLERFTDEPALVCLPPPKDDDDEKEKQEVKNIAEPTAKKAFESKYSNVSNFDEPVLLNTPLFDEDECFDPGGDNDEIDAFLAIEISTYIEEGYYDSEGDVFYLERLLIDDTSHNFFPEVFIDHEPQCFKDESELDTLKNMVKVFDPGIWEKTFSPFINLCEIII